MKKIILSVSTFLILRVVSKFFGWDLFREKYGEEIGSLKKLWVKMVLYFGTGPQQGWSPNVENWRGFIKINPGQGKSEK